jgi:hypothetical protein
MPRAGFCRLLTGSAIVANVHPHAMRQADMFTSNAAISIISTMCVSGVKFF